MIKWWEGYWHPMVLNVVLVFSGREDMEKLIKEGELKK